MLKKDSIWNVERVSRILKITITEEDCFFLKYELNHIVLSPRSYIEKTAMVEAGNH